MITYEVPCCCIIYCNNKNDCKIAYSKTNLTNIDVSSQEGSLTLAEDSSVCNLFWNFIMSTQTKTVDCVFLFRLIRDTKKTKTDFRLRRNKK